MRQRAFHDAGHALATALTGQTVNHVKLTREACGLVIGRPAQPTLRRDRVIVELAGIAGEMVGTGNHGAIFVDIERAVRVAREIPEKDRIPRKRGRHDWAKWVPLDVRGYLVAAYDSAEELLASRRAELTTLATLLLRRKRVYGAEIERILDGKQLRRTSSR